MLSGSIDFGEVPVGETGPKWEQGIGISNTGSVPVEVTAFGEAIAPFYYAGTTCATLPPFTLATAIASRGAIFGLGPRGLGTPRG